MASRQTFTVPSDVVAEAALVLMDGPNGLAATFTPDAALETGNRLVAAAAEAMRQGADGKNTASSD